MSKKPYIRPRPVLSGQVAPETAKEFQLIARITGQNKSQILESVIGIGLPVFIKNNNLGKLLKREKAA
jgi:hypothetical protein